MKKMKASTMRTLVLWAVVLCVVLCGIFKAGTGTLSTFGIKTVSLICPLGALEALLAAKTLIPHVVISIVVFVLLAVLLGRVFCAWICPVSAMRKWFPSRARGSKEPPAPETQVAANAGPQATEAGLGAGDTGRWVSASAGCPMVEMPAAPAKQGIRHSTFHPDRAAKVRIDSRHWVLGGALLSTAVFGFPVFCLICPVGLTFATLAAYWRLFDLNEPSWGLLLFPGIILVELVVFKKWCRNICPLGALVSLVSSLNIFNRPKVDTTKCLRTTKGLDCRICKDMCYEGIDLHHADASQPLSECTKCRDCADACPVGAITFPFKGGKDTDPASVEAGRPSESSR